MLHRPPRVNHTMEVPPHRETKGEREGREGQREEMGDPCG